MPKEELSELLFRRFCRANRLTLRRIAAGRPGTRRPDFRLTGKDKTTIIVEVKQFDPTLEERQAFDYMMAGGVATFGVVPGDRLRGVITGANRQLKTKTRGRHPGVLVVFNNVMAVNVHIDPYAILTAMRGLDVIPVYLPRDPAQSPQFGPVKPGPGKKLTPSANTTTSAIAILRTPADEPLVLDVYHNPHAKVPLPPESLQGTNCAHYRMRLDQMGWDHCPAG